MHTFKSLLADLRALQLDPRGTVLVHSSMKSIGEVEGGADTVLDAWCEHWREGLLILPTHTWSYIDAKNPRFSVEKSPSCVGLLTEKFRKRPGVCRSWHPTHSVAACGPEAAAFVRGDERFETPCARGSAWGRLLDRKATILLVGVDLTRNTFLHGVEEWADIPERLGQEKEPLQTITPAGQVIDVGSYRHVGQPSERFDKVEDLFLRTDAMRFGRLGDATVRVCDAVKMNDLLQQVLQKEPALFSDDRPLDPKIQQALLSS